MVQHITSALLRWIAQDWRACIVMKYLLNPKYQQEPALTISDVTASTGATVLIPITVTNFTNVGAITLKITYDPAVVTYVDTANSAVGFTVGHGTPGVTILAWYSTTPLNISSGKLIDLKFTYLGGTSSVEFTQSACEIDNNSGLVISGVTYTNGSISRSIGMTVSGTVAYANTTATPIGSATVTLTPTTGTALTAISSATNGTYTFATVPAGTYTLTASKTGNWGGCTAADALLIARHVVGIALLNGLPLQAADVNASGSITAADALLITRRVVGLDNSFVAGDWVFNSQSVTIAISNLTGQNVSGLCVGDVNASYTTTGTAFAKSASISLRNGTDKFSISASSPVALGAVTLKLNMNSAKVASVSSKLPGFVSNVTDAGVLVAWFAQDGKPVQFDANEAIVTVTLADKATNNSSITVESELADITGTAVNIDLALAVKVIPTVFELSQNYPNPFNPSTQINYSLPQSGMVTLSVYNLLGQEVAGLVNEQKEAGTYITTWNAQNCPSGIYFYRLTAGSNTMTRKLLLLR